MARYNVDLQDDKGNAYQTMANPDSVAEFSPAPSRENIKSGETHRVIFGKIMKYLSEVGNAAYVGLANNCTTTVEGFALDARQGKELMDRINELNRDFAGGQMEIRLTEAGKGEYRKKGADTWTPFKSDTIIPLLQLQPEKNQTADADIVLDTIDKNNLHIDSFSSWYDNASITITSNDVELFFKYHKTGGSNRVDTTDIGDIDVSQYNEVHVILSVVSINAKGWGKLNNIIVS